MSETEQAPAGSGDEPAVSELLIRAREAAGLTQEDVAAQLYLTATFIDYIDQGQFHKIPKGTAFIKGYLRSYARVVGLDGDDMVGRYEAALPGASDVAPIRDVTEETVGPATFTGPVLQTGLAALAGLAVVVGLVWYFTAGPSDETDQSETEEADAVEVGVLRSTPPATPGPASGRRVGSDAGPDDAALQRASMPEAAVTDPALEDAAVTSDRNVASGDRVGGADANTAAPQDLGRIADAAGEVAVAPDTDAFPLVGESLVDSQSFADSRVDGMPMDEFEDPGVSIQREGEGEDRLITVTADGSDALDFRFTDDCWVRIEDAADKIIYEDLNRGGDIMSVTGTGPFTVLLGKASVVRMDYNGAPFDLGRYTMSDETARVRTR